MSRLIPRPQRLAALLLVLTTACSGSSSPKDDDAALINSVRAYNESFLAGRSTEAWNLLSDRCHDRIGEGPFGEIVDAIVMLYPGVETLEVSIDDLSGDLARVTSRFTDELLDQDREPWVQENGQWHNDDC